MGRARKRFDSGEGPDGTRRNETRGRRGDYGAEDWSALRPVLPFAASLPVTS